MTRPSEAEGNARPSWRCDVRSSDEFRGFGEAAASGAIGNGGGEGKRQCWMGGEGGTKGGCLGLNEEIGHLLLDTLSSSAAGGAVANHIASRMQLVAEVQSGYYPFVESASSYSAVTPTWTDIKSSHMIYQTIPGLL